MGKVKKAGAVGKSNGKRSSAAKQKRRGVTKVAPKTVAKPANGRKTGAKTKARMASTKSKRGKVATKVVARKLASPPSVSTFHVRELDPFQKCGAGTSVQRMFRIDETNAGAVRSHLVFLDRHGLYCEHGRDCPAVPFARSKMAHDNP